MRIYVASSWRNDYQQKAVQKLRGAGFEVYDFRNPRIGDYGFQWSDIDPAWQDWTPSQFAGSLQHNLACKGYKSDIDALRKADVVLLVMPCGRSAHLEAGFAAGRGKLLFIWIPEKCEPELMYKMGIVSPRLEEIIEQIKETQ